LFITIEDETGFSNLVVWEKLFDKYRKEILQSRLLMVEGKVQIEGLVIHVVVNRCFNLSKYLSDLVPQKNEDVPVLTLSRADERIASPDQRNTTPDQNRGVEKVFHKGRNFQ
jgi:error-prone DNA polymerase